MICGKVSVFFFGYSCLLLKSCSQPSISSKPSSRIACLLSNVRANCISLVSPLLPCFVFSKATTSFRRPGKHLGQQCHGQAGMELKQSVCFRTKTIHWMSWTSSFPTVTTHLIVDMQTPPLGVVFHPTDCPSRIRFLAIKRFIIRIFGRLDSLSSAHHFGLSSPQIACLGKSCLTFGKRIISRHFIEIRDQESVLFVDSNVHLGHPNFSKREADISTQTFFRCQPYILQSSAGNDFRSKENVLCRSVELDACRKSLWQTREFFLCYKRGALLDGSQCI